MGARLLCKQKDRVQFSDIPPIRYANPMAGDGTGFENQRVLVAPLEFDPLAYRQMKKVDRADECRALLKPRACSGFRGFDPPHLLPTRKKTMTKAQQKTYDAIYAATLKAITEMGIEQFKTLSWFGSNWKDKK